MSDHPSYQRLISVAAELDPPIVGPSALASALNEAPQVATNWSSRGVSMRGAIAAQREMGINAVWILEGVGDVRVTAMPSSSHPVRLDIEKLASAIATIESAFEKARASMPVLGRAKIIAAYYADLVRTPDMDPKAAADAALAAVIRSMSEGATDDQHLSSR